MSPPASAARARRERAWLAALQIALLAPFLDKPFHVDDAFFLAIAEQIARDPLHPFDFAYNWTGVPDLVAHEMKNPPLVFYAQALWHELGIAIGVDARGAWSERWLHAGFLAFALAAGQATYALASRATRAPLLASALLVASPSFWVPATSAMIDVPLVAALLAALLALERARAAEREGRPARGAWAAAAAAATAAVLSKYAALVLLPAASLPLALAAVREARAPRDAARRLAIAASAPALAFAAWWAASGGHPLAALAYRSTERGDALVWLAAHGPAALAFCGGLLGFPVAAQVAALARPDERGLALVGAGAGVAALAIRHALFAFPFSAVNDALLVVLAASGATFALLVAARARAARTPLERALLVWLAVGFAFVAVGNWTVNARSVLLVAPPAAIFAARLAEGRARLARGALAAAFALGLVVALADADLAAFGPAEATRIAREAPPGARVRFVGHWGFQRYMERAGFAHVDLAHADVRPGDVVAVPRMHRIASVPFELPAPRAREVHVVERRLPVAVMDGESGAGLHGSFLGPLPFAYATGPLEVVDVLAW
ncbi:MAG: glycosyltransferase family 39 protein [Myxococcota bacterium]